MLPRKVGSVLTSLGFSDRKRTNSGWTLQLSMQDGEKIHQLVVRYGIDGFEHFIAARQEEVCRLCKEAGLNNKGPDLPPGVPDSAIHETSIKIGIDRNKGPITKGKL